MNLLVRFNVAVTTVLVLATLGLGVSCYSMQGNAKREAHYERLYAHVIARLGAADAPRP